ncbi:hypothetical protein C8R42DRAFT_645553 [Lentinula raphanica]|nr:hypothetical protein C8R42DRAFT_645553 [Lentinula raphanica]
MGMHHIASSVSERHTITKSIRARLYSANLTQPKAVTARVRHNTRRPAKDRFVYASLLLSGQRTQPYLHDTVVTIQYGGRVFTFLVFFKRHKRLPVNVPIQNIGGKVMRGDVLLVACGTKVSIRNLQSGLEDKAADRAVKRLSEQLDPIANRRYFRSKYSFLEE